MQRAAKNDIISQMKLKTILSLLLFLIIGLWFYWFQWRPSRIKHDCSWIKHHSDAIQAKEGFTESQLKERGMLIECPLQNQQKAMTLIEYYRDTPDCFFENKRIIELNKPIKYIPAKDWWVKATKDEYTFCLHNNGL